MLRAHGLYFIYVNLRQSELLILERTLQLPVITIIKTLSVTISVSPLIPRWYNYLE